MSAPLSALDHVVILAADAVGALANYEALFGRAASARHVEDGVAVAVIATANVDVELLSPVGAGARADRVRAALAQGDGLKSLAFRTPDIRAFHRRAERVGLRPGEIAAGADLSSVRLADDVVGGVRLFAVERSGDAALETGGDVLGLDHVVVRTSDPERAAATYGARLGLDMRLDREVRGRRLMFFRCGDAIVEIAVESGLDADQLWGLSWRVADAAAAQRRLRNEGFDVSEIRAGAKPGTRVFTVRDRTAGVPTLMIEPAPSRD